MKMKLNRKGFTLIELLIVIVIIGILALALLPTILEGPAKARDAARLANMNKIRNAYIKYIVIDGNEPPAEFTQSGDSTNADDVLGDILSIFPDNNTTAFNNKSMMANVAYAEDPYLEHCEDAKSEDECVNDTIPDCKYDNSARSCTEISGGKPGSNGHFGVTKALVEDGATSGDGAVFMIFTEIEKKNGNIDCNDINGTNPIDEVYNDESKYYYKKPTLSESSSKGCYAVEIKLKPEEVLASSVEEGGAESSCSDGDACDNCTSSKDCDDLNYCGWIDDSGGSCSVTCSNIDAEETCENQNELCKWESGTCIDN